MIGDRRGQRFQTQLNGQTVTVRVTEIEQSINSRHRGKWVCINEATGRKLHRTDRQLRGPLQEEEQPPTTEEILSDAGLHKAEPAPEFAEDAASTCIHCHRDIRRVPGGHGPTWVHTDTGTIVGRGLKR